jgi:serine/threonine protein kinase
MKLSHPNLVRLFGVLNDPTHGPCLLLELCEGGSLSSVLNEAYEGRISLPWQTRVKWLREIAVGVDVLHSWQPSIIHRDLKSANVILSSEDFDTAVAKVADFGVSTTLEKTKMSTASARGGAGTLAWNAPETFDGKYSGKSDTYSFAMVMYETLTFLVPHAGKSSAEITRMGMEKFKVNKKLEERGISAEEQEADWLEENPLKARRPIFEAVKDNLGKREREEGRELKDLQSGKFEDSAKGFKSFLQVPEDWVPEKECEVPKLVEEVRRLADCAECAKVQVQVLEGMVGGSEDLRGTLEITKRLANVLTELQKSRGKGNRKEDEGRLENQVQLIREEIDQINGWYYGRQNAPAVAWPEAQVKHDWGKYGQPMCEKCKRYKLDHSTISADFNYVLYEMSSEKEYHNGVRDKDMVGKIIDDFVNMSQSKMNKSQAASLRFYSSPSFSAVTIPLRDPDRETQHPLAAIAYCIFTGIKKQLTLGAEDQDAAVQEVIFWRGFRDLKISDDFKKHGGSEYAPMSTSTDLSVAVGYAVRKSQTDEGLLMRIVTKNNLERGIVCCVLLFPILSRPCSYISCKLGYLEGTRTDGL